MIIVYHDFGGTHSTALAAAIHLGIVGKNGAESVSADELVNRVPYFDQVPGYCKGTVMHVGKESTGHEVYILGRRKDAELAINAVLSACRFIGQCEAEFMFVDVSKRVNWLMRIGGFLSRGLRMIQLGRPIVVKGTQIAYPSIAQLVEKTRRSIEQHSGSLCCPQA